MDQILKNPTTVKMLAQQLKIVCDQYLARKIPEKTFKEYIWHFAKLHGDKLFSADSLNPTVINRIGKKRARLINIMLKNFQTQIF